MREDWEEKELGELISIVPGKYIQKSEYVESGPYWIYGSNSIMGRYSKALVHSPHIVMAAIGAYAGAVRYSRDPSWVNNNAFAIVPNEQIDSYYLHLWLSSALDQSRIIAGTGQPYVQRPALIHQRISLPSRNEQRRIVDLMSAVDEYIAALQWQADAARTARTAVLHEMLTAGGDDWVETTVGSVCVVKGGKRLPKGTPWSQSPTPHPYIRATDFRDGRIDTTNLVYVPDDVWPTVSRYVVEANDVLITIAGTIGAVALVPATHVGANLTENAALMRPVDSSIDCRFLHVWLLSENAQRQITELTIGTTQQKLGLFRIESLKLTLPSLGEQKRIVAIVSSMDDLINATESAIVESNNLRSGLLSDLLAGEHEIPASYDQLLGAA